jgi:O-antigen ligase
MKFVRFALYGLIAFSVLAHGGVEEWARAVFETGAGLLFLCWALLFYAEKRTSLFVTPLLPPLVALLLLAAGQWLFHLSLLPFATRVEFQLLLADILLVFVAAQTIRKLEDWKGFFWFLMIFAFAVSVFGILQHLTFNGKLYWFRELGYGGIPFGPYVNRNHFAAFAELTAPLTLVPLVLGKVRRERLFIVGVFAVMQVGALLLSASRGGIISFACQIGVLAVVMIRRREKAKAVVAAAVLAAAFAMVSWLGVRQVLQRFSGMQSVEVTEAKRLAMALGTWHIFLDYPILGTGLGTIQAVYPAYETLYDAKVVNHTHNDYLEALAETGAVGGFCCAGFLVIFFLESRQRLLRPSSPFGATLQLAAWIGCLGFLVHSLVDFNLHIPANAILFFLLALLATTDIPAPSIRVASRHRRSTQEVPASVSPETIPNC